MDLSNWFKDKFSISKESNNFDLEKYKKDKLLNEPFIEHYFAIQFIKPKDYTFPEFDEYMEKVNLRTLELVGIFAIQLSKMCKSITTKSYKITEMPQEYFRVLSMTNANKNSYFTLIRFPDVTKKEAEKGFKEGNLRYLAPNKKRNYLFTPLQSLKFLEFSKSIEFQLQALAGLEPVEQMTLINGVDKEVIITEYDGIQYYYYPLSKRAELYSKFPELDKKMFDLPFPEFIKWLLNKEKESEYMHRNAERTRQILKKYNL